VPVEEAFPKGWIRESTELSLRELGIETIDLMQLHQYWPQWSKQDYWLEELRALKQEGKIGMPAFPFRISGTISRFRSR